MQLSQSLRHRLMRALCTLDGRSSHGHMLSQLCTPVPAARDDAVHQMHTEACAAHTRAACSVLTLPVHSFDASVWFLKLLCHQSM